MSGTGEDRASARSVSMLRRTKRLTVCPPWGGAVAALSPEENVASQGPASASRVPPTSQPRVLCTERRRVSPKRVSDAAAASPRPPRRSASR